MNGVGVLLWRRFEDRHESFPDLSGRGNWYDIKLFTVATGSTPRTQAIGYSAIAAQIASILKKFGITADMCTHIFRHDGAEQLEMNSEGWCPQDQILRLGGWNYSIFASTYAGLPMSGTMAAAGHPAKDFKSSFLLDRAPTKADPVPVSILATIFPNMFVPAQSFLDSLSTSLLAADGRSVCGASIGFAKLIVYLCRTLIEDFDGLKKICPTHDFVVSCERNPELRAWNARRQAKLDAARNSTNAVAAASEAGASAASAIESSPVRRAFCAVNQTMLGVSNQVGDVQQTLGARPPHPIFTLAPSALAIDELDPLAPSALRTTSPAGPVALTLAPPPIRPPYALTPNKKTITEFWVEFVFGRASSGTPSVRQLRREHGKDILIVGLVGKERMAVSTLVSKHKIVWDEVERLGQASGNEEQAAFALQERFAASDMTISAFLCVLQSERRARQISSGKRPAFRERSAGEAGAASDEH